MPEIATTQTLACEVVSRLLNQTANSVPTAQELDYVSPEV